MNTSNVTVKSYLPSEKERVRSKLQQVKDKHRSFTQTNKQGIPKDFNELKLIKYREHAITFLNEYMNIDKKTTKSEYCKSNHISHNSLNNALKLMGHATTRKAPKAKPIKTKSKQSRPIIKAGKILNDEEINEIIENSLANLSLVNGSDT